MTEFYHHGVKGQKWGVTHDRPKARRKYVTNNGEGVHRRGRVKASKEHRLAAQLGAYEKALSQHSVTTHRDLGYPKYGKEAMVSIMKNNPPPSPSAPGYSQYWYDLLARPDLLCSTESYENMQDPNSEGQPPYYIRGSAEEGYYDAYGNPVLAAYDDEEDKLKQAQVIWYVPNSDGSVAGTPSIPLWHSEPNKIERAAHIVSQAVRKIRNETMSKVGRSLSNARYGLMKRIWAKHPNFGVHKVKDLSEDL